MRLQADSLRGERAAGNFELFMLSPSVELVQVLWDTSESIREVAVLGFG